MAISCNTSSLAQWEDFKMRIVADYAGMSSMVFDEVLEFPLCDLKVEVDDFSIRIGDKRHLFEQGGPGADVLCSAVSCGEQPVLTFFYDPEYPPQIMIKNQEGSLLAIANLCSDDAFGLPRILNDEVCSIVMKMRDSIMVELESALEDRLEELYDKMGISRSDELVMKLSEYLISDDSPLNADQLYNVLQLLPEENIRKIKEETLHSVKDFYYTLFENGEMDSVYAVESCVAHARKRLDDYLSTENLLFGKLSNQVSNFGVMKGEVQTDDIARVAVWAEKDPAFAPYLGKRLEKWVVSEAKGYGLKAEIVNKKRQLLGGRITTEPFRVPMNERVKQSAAKRFSLKQ